MLVSLSLSNAAFGATVFDQSPPFTAFAGISDFAGPFANQGAQRFSLPTDADIRAVQVWGHYLSGLPSDNFVVRFFADVAGAPDAVPLASFSAQVFARTPTGLFDAAGEPIYLYSLNLPSAQSLAAGTDFYVSVVNNTSGATLWSWQGFSGGNNIRWTRGGGPSTNNAWGAGTGNFAFRLLDTFFEPAEPESVPTLPAQALILLIGLMLFAAYRRMSRTA